MCQMVHTSAEWMAEVHLPLKDSRWGRIADKRMYTSWREKKDKVTQGKAFSFASILNPFSAFVWGWGRLDFSAVVNVGLSYPR